MKKCPLCGKMTAEETINKKGNYKCFNAPCYEKGFEFELSKNENEKTGNFRSRDLRPKTCCEQIPFPRGLYKRTRGN